MKTKTLDTRGMMCPAPIIEVRKEIKKSNTGDQIEVLVDNDVAYSNLVNYLSELGIQTACSKKDFVHTITFTMLKADELASESSTTQASIIADATKISDYAVVIKSDTMGEGDSRLGEMLLRGYLNALVETDNLPEYVALYNGGVKCAIEGTDTQAALSSLEAKGVRIVICGACVDFYELAEKIAVGEIRNMYKITEITSMASHVVYP